MSSASGGRAGAPVHRDARKEMPGIARVAAVVTLAQGLAVLVFGVGVAGVLVPAAGLDPWWAEEVRLVRGALGALAVVAVTVLLAGLHGLGAVGIWRGSRWGGVLAGMLGVLALFGACFPVGVALLALLVQPEVRAWCERSETREESGSPGKEPVG